MVTAQVLDNQPAGEGMENAFPPHPHRQKAEKVQIPIHPPRFWQKAIQKLAATPLASRFVSRWLPPLDRIWWRWTKGRGSLTSLLTGLPVVVLTATGARSGQPRHTPLVAFPDGERVILIASNFGAKSHPAWYYNLRAHPRVTLNYRGESQVYDARLGQDNEKRKYWKKANQLYAGYDAYQAWSGGREIPVMVLTPVRKTASTNPAIPKSDAAI